MIESDGGQTVQTERTIWYGSLTKVCERKMGICTNS
jgi:hypothetical protein